MNSMIMIGIDLLAIAVLTFGVYFPRHHRRDLVVAFLGVNVGVLAVSMVLGSTTIGAGLGLGLFGVLSIIRLRSSEISQHEVAYYFAALALGLLAGLATPPVGPGGRPDDLDRRGAGDRRPSPSASTATDSRRSSST